MENSELISKAVEYAKTHFRDDISIGDVADHAGFSLDYFNRIFLAHTGFTVMAYINYIRLKKAAVALRSTEKSVLDIALDAGYDSHEGFTRAFTKRYGVSPSDYRKNNRAHVLSWADLIDSSVAARFLHDNPDFKPIDTDTVIDELLETDAKRYGHFCTSIKYEGLTVASHDGTTENGFIAIGDNGEGGWYVEVQTENFDLLAEWIRRFGNSVIFYMQKEPDDVLSELECRGVVLKGLDVCPQSYYLDDPLDVTLPYGISVRKLEATDKDAIAKWANGEMNGYIAHLLNEKHYLDPNVLDYGIFLNGKMVAAVSCGIDEVRGFKLNNCCVIHTLGNVISNELYRSVYKYVTNDIIAREVLPFDDTQHGKFAENNGGFTAEELGFTTVCRKYTPRL